MIKKIFFLSLFIILFSIVFSQEEEINGLPFITNISPQEYRQHVQNWDILQDNRGIMYIANGNGVIEYDGETFRLIELPGKETVRSLAIDSNNRIYVGSVGEFGYLEPNSKGKTQYKSLTSKIPGKHKNFGDTWDTQCKKEAIFFRSYNKLFRYAGDTMKIWTAQSKFTSAFTINETLYVNDQKNGLFKIQGDSLERAPYGCLFANNHYFVNAIEITGDKALFSSENKLYSYNPSAPIEKDAISRIKTDSDDYLDEGGIYTLDKTRDNKFIIGTHANKGILIIDSTGRTLQKINTKAGLQKGGIYNITTDREGNAWLAMSNGIAKVDISSPITYWNDQAGLQGAAEDIIIYNNTLYTATHQGLYYLSEQGEFKRLGNFRDQCWAFLVLREPGNPERTRLLVAGRDEIFEVKNKNLHRLWLIEDATAAYYLTQSKRHPELIYAGVMNGAISLKYKDGKIVEEKRIIEKKEDTRSIAEDKDGNLWLASFRNGVMKLKMNNEGTKATDIKHYNKKDGFRSTKNILIYPFQERLIFASDKGMHKYDTENDRFIPDSTLGEQFGDGSRDIYCFREMEDGTVWCSGLNNKTGKISRGIPNKTNGYNWEFREFGRIPTMMVLGMHIEENGTAWIGGSEGLFKYDPENSGMDKAFHTLIRKITIGKDSLIFGGNGYIEENNSIYVNHHSNISQPQKISYNNNTITFDFAALSYKDMNENQYSFYLDGFEDDWSSWSKTSKKQYTNLREGNYVFHVKSRNLLGIEGNSMRFEFTVEPPWYRNTVAYISYGLFLGLLFYLGLLYNSRRLKEKNRKLEEIIRERTREISEQKKEIQQQKEEMESQRNSIANQAKQLRLINQELKKLTIVASETDNAIIITDPEGNIEWINEGFVRLFGYNIEEVRENFGNNLLKGNSAKYINEIFNKVITNKTSEIYESNVVAKNGETIHVNTTLTPVLDEQGEVEKVIAIDSDIRELKKAKEELEKLNATKDKFFSIIAHDLKNPFSSLLGATDILLRKFYKMEKERIYDFIKEIKQVTKHGYDLLVNLLEWSRAQTGRLDFEMENINLHLLVENNISLLQTAANNKRITLYNQVDPKTTAFADANTIQTVLRNLLSNAIKYSHKEGTIFVSAEENKDYIKITVQDEGIGIPEDIQEKIFRIDENFSQKGTNDESGTGLGLVLCKEFVEMNKGAIWVESREGHGSKFFITLLKAN
ncbi:MAG: ATP-binding protein [Bacteroidales bacterium]